MRSFHFNENIETIDAYIHCIRQVATLLCYVEPQILEFFKNTLPTRLYWVLFPLDDFQLAVEMAKRILMKEKKERQLAGQSSFTQFLNIQEEHNKRVTFDTTDHLEQKTDKLMVMMGKLVMKDNGQNRQFKPQFYQTNRGKGQIRCNYKQRSFQDRFRSDSSRSNTFRRRPRYGQEYQGRSRYDLKYRGNYRNNMRGNQRYGRKIIIELDSGEILKNQSYERGRSRSNDRQFRGNNKGTIKVLVTVDKGQVLEWVPIEIEVHVWSVKTAMQCKQIER